MTAQTDLVRIELVALALDASMNKTRRAYLKGKIPPPDVFIKQGPVQTAHWRLATLRAHDPELGRRCAALNAALESVPLKPAA